MKIKARLRINTSIALCVALVIGLALFWSFREVSRTDRNKDLVLEIRKLVFERIILRDDFLLRQEDRARQQWMTKSYEIMKLLELAERRFPDSGDQALIKEARDDFTVSLIAFPEFMENRARSRGNTRKAFLSDEADKIILGQVFMKAYALNNDIRRLYEAVEKEAFAARHLAVRIVVLFVLCGIVIVMANSVLISRTFSKKLADLGRGVAILGEGNLDHRIEIKGDDEFSELARASNAMAAKLKESYTSVDNLQREMVERKRAEERFVASEVRYRRLFEAAKDGILILDAETGMIVDVNPFLIKMLGFSHEALLGKKVWDLGFFKNIVANQDNFVELQQKQYLRYEDLPLETADGRRIEVEFISNVYLVNSQKVIQCNIRDITERKRADAALRESEAQFRTLADSIPNLAWWANADGYITWYNRRWYEYTGTTPEQMEGWGWQSVHDPKTLPKVLERWKASIATGELFDMEFPLRGADGVFRPFLTRVLPLKDPVGRILRWFGANTDISTLKQAEEKIRRLNEELEQRVAERTAQFEAANRELEAFSYSVSHDLRAPLRAVDGYTRMLFEGYGSRLDAEGQRICSVISESARDMGKLIDDLLAFSRVGRTAMQLSPMDMETMARSIFFEATTPESRERIDFHVGPLPTAVGDPTLIRQVWKNLLSNAVKFSSKKERAAIEVSAGRQGNETVYTVRDNGAGFDMQYVDKLFGVFQRLHSTKEFEGTGVGLAIVQRIIVRHGGRVWAEGETGKGATFNFTIN